MAMKAPRFAGLWILALALPGLGVVHANTISGTFVLGEKAVPVHEVAAFRMRDQKPDRAHLLRQPQLDAAVHMPGRERIFVADHDDSAADAVRVLFEILGSAQAEIEDFRH